MENSTCASGQKKPQSTGWGHTVHSALLRGGRREEDTLKPAQTPRTSQAFPSAQFFTRPFFLHSPRGSLEKGPTAANQIDLGYEQGSTEEELGKANLRKHSPAENGAEILSKTPPATRGTDPLRSPPQESECPLRTPRVSHMSGFWILILTGGVPTKGERSHLLRSGLFHQPESNTVERKNTTSKTSSLASQL